MTIGHTRVNTRTSPSALIPRDQGNEKFVNPRIHATVPLACRKRPQRGAERGNWDPLFRNFLPVSR